MAVADVKLKQLLQPVVEALGCQLWGLDLQAGGKTKLLRIYIDRAEDGIGIEDCEKVSRQLRTLEEAINGADVFLGLSAKDVVSLCMS